MIALRRSIDRSIHWLGQHPQTWLRPLFVAAVLLVTVGVSLTGSARLMQLLIAAIFGLAGAVFFWRWPGLSLVLTLIGGMFIGYSGPAGISVTVLGIALLLAIWAVEIALRWQPLIWILRPTSRPLIALIIVTLISFAVGQLPWFPIASPAPMQAQVGGVLIFIFSAAAFLLVAHYINSITWLKVLTWMMVILGAIHISGWLVPGAGRFVGGIFAPGTTNNAMFWIWLVSIAFSQALINDKLHIGVRIGLGILTAATLYVAFFLNGGWKSGYLPGLVAVAAIFGLRYPRIGVFMAIVGIFPAQYLFNQAVSTDVYSFVTRFDALEIMLKLSQESPLIGFGPANYYWYVPLYRIRGYVSVFSSHNQYLDILAQVGILGLVCVFWFAWETGKLGWKLRHTVAAGFERAYVYGALGGLVASMAAGVLADWMIPFVYNIGFTGYRASVLMWIYLGGLVILANAYRMRRPIKEF